MYSKKQLGIMVKESQLEFDYIVYLRPDVKYINKFDIQRISNLYLILIWYFIFFIWLFTNLLFFLGLIYLCFIIIKSIINLENLPIDLIIIYYFDLESILH